MSYFLSASLPVIASAMFIRGLIVFLSKLLINIQTNISFLIQKSFYQSGLGRSYFLHPRDTQNFTLT